MRFDRQVTALAPGGAILITQGEFAVSEEPDLVISTLLGSCVACCLWDDTAGIGGMNHLLLGGELKGASAGYDLAGVAEMECLINEIIKRGGRRAHLKAKIFGGAKMLSNLGRIGENNAQFAHDYLKQEGIPCLNSSVGGTSARAVRFWGATGRAIMRLVANEVDEKPVLTPAQAAGNEMELF
jgi:chemotaxis protein CheD